MNYALIIPTLNAAADIGRLLSAVLAQTLPPSEILIVDSSSEDETVSIASRVPGVRCIVIPRAEFDHGGTRDAALRSTRESADGKRLYNPSAQPIWFVADGKVRVAEPGKLCEI